MRQEHEEKARKKQTSESPLFFLLPFISSAYLDTITKQTHRETNRYTTTETFAVPFFSL